MHIVRQRHVSRLHSICDLFIVFAVATCVFLENNVREALNVLKPDPFLTPRLFLPLNSPCSHSVSLANPSAGAMASFTHGYGI